MENFIDNIYCDSPSQNDNINNNHNTHDNDDNHSIIDTSWIQEYDKLNQINNNQERTFMDTINTYFVYINKNLYFLLKIFYYYDIFKRIRYSDHIIDRKTDYKDLKYIHEAKYINQYASRLKDFIKEKVYKKYHDLKKIRINSSWTEKYGTRDHDLKTI